ncbi:MAG: hypothetical protein QM820_31505 [Minicystis sp.]
MLDENPVEPGANFLPVGAEPTAIVSTPGSVASFVTVAEIGRAGIFALPSANIRPASTAAINADGTQQSFDPGTQRLSSWPACALPSAPGDMILVNDPTDEDGLERETCDAEYTSANIADLLSSLEQRGRQKLIVAMPDLGGVAVIDAQRLLNQDPGSFAPCEVERWLPLDVKGIDIGPPPALPTGQACVNPTLPKPDFKAPERARPGGLAYADGKLYVADLAAPVIHVVDMPTPCEPVEQAPLVATSVENPARIVKTGRVAITPAPTPELKQYLYATDIDDGSIMVFDVSPSSTTRRPLKRQHPEWNPFVPVDRIRYGAPAADVLVLSYESPSTKPLTGNAMAGVLCDPDPSKVTCTETTTSCDIGTSYVTNTSTYQTGAGPARLRGTFAFAALTNGRLAVIDVEDLDRDCRGPLTLSTEAGCAKDDKTQLNTSLEASCNVVLPHAPRAANYEVSNTIVGNYAPSTVSLPQLFDANGGLISTDSASPLMSSPACTNGVKDGLESDVDCGGGCSPCAKGRACTQAIDCASSVCTNSVCQGDSTQVQAQHTLAMNYEDPRAQIVDQEWTIGFEGALPGFLDRLGDLRAQKMCAPPPPACPAGETCPTWPQHDCPSGSTCNVNGVCEAPGPFGIFDPNSRFCDFGVQSGAAVKERFGAELTRSDAEWMRLADYVQIASPLPDEQGAYWRRLKARFEEGSNPHDPSVPVCTVQEKPDGQKPFWREMRYTDCSTRFGTTDAPTTNRDLRIIEAYQDHVELARRPEPGARATPPELAELAEVKCCFPDAVAFNVRVGSQWIVVGALSGFLHHVVADPSTGVCRESCDPTAERKSGRAMEQLEKACLEKPGAAKPEDCFTEETVGMTTVKYPGTWVAGDPTLLFKNPMFGFQILAAQQGSVPSRTQPDRDKFFRFTTVGSFVPLLVTLTADPTAQIQPQGMAFVPPTGEIAITDGSINGLIFVSLSSVTFSRSFF